MRPRTALCVLAFLVIFHTWPLGKSPTRLSLNHNADAELNAWIISWIPHILPSDPVHLFDGNIFAPEPRVLAYSEPLLVPGLLGAPLRWFGASPVTTFNILTLAGLLLTAWSGWWLGWKWTGSVAAGLVTGTLVAFNVHLLTRLPHLAASHLWGVPLALYFADRLATEPSRRAIVGLGLVTAATAATSAYSLALAGLAVLIVAAVKSRGPRTVGAFLVAGGGGLLAALPILWPYVEQARSGHVRPLDMVAQFSATPAGYLTSTSLVHAGWSRPFFHDEVDVFFAGVAALAIATFGAASTWRATDGQRRVILLMLLAAIGIVLSLGPATAIYRWLFEWALPLRGLRAAARFGFLYLIAVAVLSGFGFAWIERRLSSAFRRRVFAGVVILVLTAEAWQGPVKTTPFDGVPPIYALLADAPSVRLVEVPFFPPEAVFENGEYVLNATAHWRPVMNGYSGFTPTSYRTNAETFWYFPEERAFIAMKAAGVTHVMVHEERFRADEQSGLERSLASRPDLALVGADSRGHRLYRLR